MKKYLALIALWIVGVVSSPVDASVERDIAHYDLDCDINSPWIMKPVKSLSTGEDFDKTVTISTPSIDLRTGQIFKGADGSPILFYPVDAGRSEISDTQHVELSRFAVNEKPVSVLARTGTIEYVPAIHIESTRDPAPTERGINYSHRIRPPPSV